jgi:hypothetical protein
MMKNYIFYFNQLIDVNFLLLTLIESSIYYKGYLILFFISLFILTFIHFLNKSDKTLKIIGHIGSGVLIGIGALESSLNLYDRLKNKESNISSSSNYTNNENNKDKDSKIKIMMKIKMIIKMLKNKSKENYLFSGILPFIINIIGKDIPNDADPFITFCFNISIIAIIVLICFTNAIAYILTIYFMKIYSLESKFPILKKILKYFEKTSLYFILVELLIGYTLLLTIIVICLYSIGIIIK